MKQHATTTSDCILEHSLPNMTYHEQHSFLCSLPKRAVSLSVPDCTCALDDV